ncbi:MAG: hypothetical protein ACPGGK_14220 [Pikeienuella sp.]
MDGAFKALMYSPKQRNDHFANLPSGLCDGLHEMVIEEQHYDLSRYYLHCAEWIANHPQLIVLPSAEWSERIKEIVEKSPCAAFEMRRRDLEKMADEMPEPHMIARASAMAKLTTPDGMGRYFLRVPQVTARVGLPRGYDKLYLGETTEKDLYVGITKTQVIVHAAKTNWLKKAIYQPVLGLRRAGLTSAKFAFTVMLDMPEKIPCEIVADAEIRPEHATLFQELHLPEAIIRWRDDDGNLDCFRNGNLLEIDVDVGWLVWRYPNASGTVTITASREYVQFHDSVKNHTMRYPASELNKLRKELTSEDV